VASLLDTKAEERYHLSSIFFILLPFLGPLVKEGILALDFRKRPDPFPDPDPDPDLINFRTILSMTFLLAKICSKKYIHE
jgi:hypothetical protein